MIERDFEVIKTTQDFLRNYDKHDELQKAGCEWLLNNGFEIIKEGDDRRYESVWEAGDSSPDFIMRSPTQEELYVDWKSKGARDWIGWINQRDYHAYKQTDLPVFIGFGLVRDGIVEYKLFCRLNKAECEDLGEQWDGNLTYDLVGTAYVSQYQFIDRYKNGEAIVYREKDAVIDSPLAARPQDSQKILNWFV